MAKFFKPTKQLKSRKHASAAKQLSHFVGVVEKYDLNLKAIVSNPHNKVAFVSGLLKGEKAKIKPTSYTDKVLQGDIVEIIEPSAQRIKPNCPHFGTCGGCQLQYLSNDNQVVEKQAALKQLLEMQLGPLQAEWQEPINSLPWGYRRTARLALWWTTKSKLTLGFRESKSKHIVNIDSCPILTPNLEKIALTIKPTLLKLENGRHLTHLQLFDLNSYQCVILRATDVLSLADQKELIAFAEGLNVHLLIEYNDNRFDVLRSHKDANQAQLHYNTDNLKFEFSAKDFIQVNQSVNDKMIQQAMTWLNPSENDVILDLFSGVGNFTLPLAKRCKQVIGVEGVNDMVNQLKHNAKLNGLNNIEAYQADLSVFDEKRPPQWLKPIDKLLLDPARDGALAVMHTIPKIKPKQILYISCNPATMVRDLKVLIAAEYQLKKVGILNMFPNTAHMEAMVLLEK